MSVWMVWMCFVVMMWYLLIFFFFKQKTAYELRMSDWSSDVCSSDLVDFGVGMMHPVQPPQQCDPVEGDMLAINRQVEQQHAGHHDQPSRQRQQVEQPDAGLAGPERRTEDRKSTRLNSSH